MSNALHRQVPINGTIQTIVPPGNQTNSYFILVSNLPWQTSWQQLKDHVRTVCPVERVEVFNDSTSGWVCVRGRENYDTALRLLNGGAFNGRALFADGKNATEPIMIKELVDTSAVSGSSPRSPRIPRYTTPPSMQYASSAPPMVSSTSAVYGEWTNTGSNSTPACMMAPAVDCAPYTVPMTMPCEYSDTTACFPCDMPSSGYFDQSTMMPVSMAQYQYPASYPQQYIGEYQGGDYGVYRHGSGTHSATTNAMIPTEMRKIIIKQIQPSATYKQVKDFMRQKAGPDADKLQQIDLPPTEGQKANNRGYALVTFETEETAARVIRKLHGCEYEGRRLEAEYTKEGVSRNETTAATATTHSRSSGGGGGSSNHHHNNNNHHHSSSHNNHHHRERERDRDRERRADKDKDHRSHHRDKKERKDHQGSTSTSTGGGGGGGGSSSTADKVKSPKSDVIIAHGSSASSATKKSGKKH